MSVHRAPIFFPKKTYINVNKTVIVNNHCNHGGMGMNSSIFGMMPMGMSMMSMGGNPLMAGFGFGDTFKNLFDGILSLFKKPDDKGGDGNLAVKKKKVETPDKPEVDTPKVDTPKVDAPKVEDPPKIEYKIEDVVNKREEVKTILYGGPWHYAQYYKGPDGEGVKPGSPEFKAIMDYLKGENGLGNIDGTRAKMTMPSTITVNGKTFTLMNEGERDALGLYGTKGTTDTKYGVKGGTNQAELFKSQNGGTDWISVGTYNSKTEAEAARKALEEGN